VSSSKKQRGTKTKPPEASVQAPTAAPVQEVAQVSVAQVSVSPPTRQPSRPAPPPQGTVLAPNELALRMLGDSLAREVIRAQASVVLVVSGRAGEGRTTLAGALAGALRDLGPAAVHRLTMRDLQCAPEPLEGIVVVDGPALLEGEGPMAVSSAWWSKVDGAIVVAPARDVPVEDLASVGRELELRGVPRLALVANERDRPPVARAIRDAFQGFWRRTFLARWMRTGAHAERMP
jgi:Mrp family chromosome partitioning ATPase